MRYGVLSDIHGNLEALEAVLRLYQNEGIEKFLCVGDIVGYGANPKECLNLIREVSAVCIAGNHDWAVAGKLKLVQFNPVSLEAIAWTQKQLSEDDMDFIRKLDLIYKNNDLILVHGTLNEPEYFHYMVYRSEAVETFHLMDRSICFIGHTHVPQIVSQQGEASYCQDELKIEIDSTKKYIVNVGSVGQPRDNNPMAAYCIFDNKTKLVEVKRAQYDIETAQEKILKSGLPAELAERLAVGQ